MIQCPAYAFKAVFKSRARLAVTLIVSMKRFLYAALLVNSGVEASFCKNNFLVKDKHMRTRISHRK